MKEKVFILYIGMILLVGGCYDDKGNYDYTDIGDITITGIENSYTAIALAKQLLLRIRKIHSNIFGRFTIRIITTLI
jgi:hypothetical protein